MDGRHLRFAGTWFPLRPSDHRAFQPQPLRTAEDGTYDPSLECLPIGFQIPSPITDFVNPLWEQSQRVQQYLNDDQMFALFDAETPSKVPPQRPTLRAVGIRPVHTTSHPGFASPLSSTDPWPGAGSALSPAADSESCHESSPDTPPDTALMSPFSRPTPVEWAQNCTRAVQFGSMGPDSSNACVNPTDINIIDPGYGDSDGPSHDFDLTTQTSFGFEPYPTQCEVEPPQSPDVASRPGRRSILEESLPIVQDEIEAILYPAPQTQTGDEGTGDDGDVVTDSNDDDDNDVNDVNDVNDADDDDDDDDDGHDDHEHNASNNVVEVAVKRKTNSDDDSDYIPGKKAKVDPAAGSKRVRSNSRSTRSPAKTRARGASSSTRSAMFGPPLAAATTSFSCSHCGQASFRDASTLETHVKKQHNQAFICVFHFAGCQSVFPSKNEWKRHVGTQHTLPKYWVCSDCDSRSTPHPAKHRSRGDPAAQSSNLGAAGGNDKIFRRKDLFTSHLRRMHRPSKVGPTSKGRKGAPHSEVERRFDDYVKARQQDCMRMRCQLPQRMCCPAKGCGKEFQGVDAWDQRMEHVAKQHLEKAARGEGPPVTFGGEGDPTLMAWAARDDVAIVKRAPGGGWMLTDNSGEGEAAAASGSGIDGGAAHVDADEEEVKSEITVENSWDPDMDADGEDDE